MKNYQLYEGYITVWHVVFFLWKVGWTSATLHEDVYNVHKQGEVNQLRNMLEDIETTKARGAATRSRVK